MSQKSAGYTCSLERYTANSKCLADYAGCLKNNVVDIIVVITVISFITVNVRFVVSVIVTLAMAIHLMHQLGRSDHQMK